MTNRLIWSFGQKMEKEIKTFTPTGKAKRQHILDSALEVISKYGFRKTTVDDIASKAGVAKGTIYIYFQNKLDIFISIVEEKLTNLMMQIFEAVKTAPDASSKLLKAIKLLIDYHQSDTLFNQLVTENPEVLGPVLLGIIKKYEKRVISFIEAILKEGIKEGSIEPNLDTEMTATILLRVNQAAILWIKTGDKLDVERYLTALEHLVKNGIKKRSAP